MVWKMQEIEERIRTGTWVQATAEA